jgi:Na+/H+ antiporter NhaC
MNETIIHPYGIMSIIPPIITIILAIISRNVIFSLALGGFSGALILKGGNIFQAVEEFLLGKVFSQISSASNTQVLLTIVCIGGFIGILEASGGAFAFARKMTSYVKSKRQAQVALWLGGLGIFFTDSGNSLILGPLFRPIFQKLKISKEKFAYILDSTSAPICILIPFISWGAYIMSLIETSYTEIGLVENPLSVLMNVMPYQFYSFLTLLSVPIIALTGKDFGPMAKAQENYLEDTTVPVKSNLSDTSFSVSEDESTLWSIIIPLVILLVSLTCLLLNYHYSETGLKSVHIRFTLIVSYVLASIGSAIFMKTRYKKSLGDSMSVFLKGGEKVLLLLYILVFAWTLSSICKELETGVYLANFIKAGVPVGFFPLIVFILGAVISLSTGTSYGTFAILMGISIPIAHEIGAPLYLTIGAILSGGLFGDHTSPISDTTILASMGAECEHMKHVNTQIVYSVLTGSVCAVGFLIAGFIDSTAILGFLFIAQSALILLVMRFYGR